MRVCQNKDKMEYFMEPTSAAALPVQSREERMNHRLMEIDRRVEGLAQDAYLIEQSLEDIRESVPETIPTVIEAIRSRHFLPLGFTTSSSVVTFLGKMLRIIKTDQNKLSDERTKIAPFANLPEDLFDVVIEQADLQTKSAAAHVSKEWTKRAVRDAQRECSEFITGELDTYLTLLARPEITSPQKERVVAELEALKNALFPEKYDFKSLKNRLVEIRDRIVQVFGQLSREDLEKLRPYFTILKSSKVAFVQKIFQVIPDLLAHDCVSCVSESLKIGDIEIALKQAASVSLPMDKSRVMCPLALKMAELGNFQEALAIARQIPRVNDLQFKTNHLLPFIFIACKMAQKGDMEGVRSLRQSLEDKGCQIAIDILIADEALDAFPTLLKPEGLQKRAEEYIHDLMDSLRSIRAFDDASSLLRIFKNKYTIDHDLGFMSRDVAESGDFKRALDLVGKIHDDHDRRFSRFAIASSMLEQGNIDGALQIYDELKVAGGGDNRDSLLRDVVVSFLKKGDMEQALKTAKKISSSSPEKLYMDSVLPVFELARRGDFKTATDMAAHTGLPFFDDVFDIIDSEKVRQMYLG